MPRKYTRKTPVAGTDTFASGLAAAMRPMIQQIVRETITEIVGEWMSKNSPATVAAAPEDIPRLAPNDSPRPPNGNKRDKGDA